MIPERVPGAAAASALSLSLDHEAQDGPASARFDDLLSAAISAGRQDDAPAVGVEEPRGDADGAPDHADEPPVREDDDSAAPDGVTAMPVVQPVIPPPVLPGITDQGLEATKGEAPGLPPPAPSPASPPTSASTPELAGVAEEPAPEETSAPTEAKADSPADRRECAAQQTAAAGPAWAAVPSSENGDASPDRDAKHRAGGSQSDAAEALRLPTSPRVVAAFVTPAAESGAPLAASLARVAAQAPPGGPSPTPAQTVENVQRLVESIRVQWRQQVSEATVRLNPAHLGEVTISVRLEQGQVAAVVHAQTAAVRQWLEAQEDKVRSSLAGQGLTLERFVVQRDGHQPERRDGRQPSLARHRFAEESGHRFEITV
jgi:flagellar hook-length control protein FliK